MVFAASSLSESFAELGAAFERSHPGVEVQFSFAGSGDLVAQIIDGAPADVFAAADTDDMTTLTDAGGADGPPRIAARNTFSIIVERGNPRNIDSLADLARSDILVVLCADSVPCGRGAAAVLERAGVSVAPKSFEDKVKGVVLKVVSGEADAGIVYTTDVLAAADRADGVEIPAEFNQSNEYPIVATIDARNSGGARQFIDFVSSDEGQQILTTYGFLQP